MKEIQYTSEITVELVQQLGNDAMIAQAARVSTLGDHDSKNDPKADAGLINYLIKHRHGSCFEHGLLTYRLHAPIFLMRELVRHRIGHSFSEESARYKELDPVFWIPSTERKLIPGPDHKSARPSFVKGDDSHHKDFVRSLKTAYECSYQQYARLVNDGFAKEAARSVLPVGTYSSMYVTVNPRSCMAFLSLRTHEPEATFVSYPQAEIEEAARKIEEIFSQYWPATYKAFVDNGRVAP